MMYDASGINCYGSVNHSAGLIWPKNGRFPADIEVRNGKLDTPAVCSTYLEDLLFVVGWSRRNAGSIGSLLGLMFGPVLFELLAALWSNAAI